MAAVAPQLGQPVPPHTFGGIFLARPSVGQDFDRTVILAEGWTIVSEEEKAGVTEFLVFGPASIAGPRLAALSDDDAFNRFALPGYFFLLPRGEILDETLIRNFPSNKDNVAF